MSLGLMFWIIWVIVVLFFGALYFGYAGQFGHLSSLVELVLFGLLGWQVFGPPIHR